MDSADADDDSVRSILVPTDGSDSAEAALEHAISMAESSGGTLHVLAVVDVTEAPLEFNVAFVDSLERTKTRLVDEIVDALDGSDVDITGAVRRGHPAQTIVTYAEEHEIDQIVLGRTGRSGLASALLGSTTSRVVRTSPVPVLVVPDSPQGGAE